MTLNSAIATRHLPSVTTVLEFIRHGFARSWLMPFLAVTLLGGILSALVFNVTSRMDDARVSRILEVRAEWRVRDFDSKLDERNISLEGVAAFIATQNKIEPAEFRNFVRNIYHPGGASSALSWAPFVKASDLNTFLAEARQTVGTQYSLWERAAEGGFIPVGNREEYLPLLFNETFDDSSAAIGLDLLSLPGRGIVVAQARDEGRPIATPPGRVFARSDMRPGFVVVWPVYSTGKVPPTVEQRRAAFHGIATSRFHFDELLPALISDTPSIAETITLLIDNIPVAFYDPAIGAFKVGTVPSAVLPDAGLTLTRDFDMLGRHWTLISTFPSGVVAGLRSDGPLMSLLFGLVLTMLLAMYIARERVRRSGIEAIVAARTTELTGSDRKLSDRTVALYGSEQRFQQIFDGNPIGLALKTTDNRHILRVNAAFCRMLGYSADELMCRTPDQLVVEADRGMATPAAAGTFPEWHPRDKHYITKSGETVQAQVQNLHLGALPSGEDAVLTIANDITEQRRTEATLHQAQKMEAIGNLTGGMAHDFNNLLGIIIGNLDLLHDLPSSNAEADELTHRALDAALRGADLTRRLLAFARQQPLQPKQVQVNELLLNITNLMRRTLGEQVEISLKLSVDVGSILIDPAQLDAAITNLATNARDAMPHGGKLTIATTNQALDADSMAANANVAPGHYVMIQVSDTGTGMLPGVASRIFEPFYTTKERGKGTGLGLSMVFGFIKQSGGHITVYSEPGIGTTFCLYLPRLMQEAADVDEHIPSPLLRGKGEVVLAVEDNVELRWVVVRQLTDLGYRVLQAENGVAAIEEMEQQHVDLLVTDIVMPGRLNGFELADQVKKRWPEIKMVFTSGFPETTLNGMVHSLPLGTSLLNKPYRKEDLATAVRVALDA